MRIAYVINSVEGGGAASLVPAVTRVLRECGAELRVFALTRRDGRGLPAMQAADLDPLVRTGGEHDHAAALRWLARETHRWNATHLLTSLTRATLLGLLLGRWRGLPTACWQHNAYLARGNQLLLRTVQSRARLWIADSDCVAGLTRSRLGVEERRLLTWPIFVADEAAPQAAPWRHGEPLRLGSLGRLHPAKGYDVLIAALAQLRAGGFRAPLPWTLRIGGEGLERRQLEAAARTAGFDQVSFTGFQQEPRRFLADLHLYLQPSRREGFCIAAHEAMAAGLPVLASAVGELPHSILEDRTGCLVPPGNVGALADALHQLLTRPERLLALGIAARARVLQRFTPQRFEAAGAHAFAYLRDGRQPAASP